MKIIIAGGNGFLGESLTNFFKQKGYQVFILTRRPSGKNNIYWDARNLGSWQESLEGVDVLINLVGKSVDCRYTPANKQEILNSRINSTRVLQKAVDQCVNPPKVWLNASSATIYKHSEDVLMKEADGVIGDDFSMGVCKAWESEFFKSGRHSTRKVALRASIVLGNNGGAFPKLKLVTRAGLGGRQGNGSQMVSWIHVKDFCRAVSFITKQNNIEGQINITAPNPISNNEMMSLLRRKYSVFAGIPSPKWVLEIASFFLRTETELLLKSRNVYPEKLLRGGFEFEYPTLSEAIKNLD